MKKIVRLVALMLTLGFQLMGMISDSLGVNHKKLIRIKPLLLRVFEDEFVYLDQDLDF